MPRSRACYQISMSTRLPTITVGIPAYNEEANIATLVREILQQTQKSFVLEAIIISSDGSSDNTVGVVKNIKNKKIIILDNKDRKGQATRQNQILKQVTSDALVLINADCVIDSPDFLTEIVSPIFSKKADLVSTHISTLPSSTFFGRTLDLSLEMKNRAFEKYKDGNNIFTCHGAARAFSRRFYQQFRFGASVGEDAYSYLFCQQKGMKYSFTKKATVKIQSPTTWQDHAHQSIRFFKTQSHLQTHFSTSMVNKAYQFPIVLMLESFLHFMATYPRHALQYLVTVVAMKCQSLKQTKLSETWVVASSSKNVSRT